MIDSAKDMNEAVLKSRAFLKGQFFIQPKDRPDLRKTFRNGSTTLGRNLLLDVMFSGTAPSTTWYLGVIAASGFSALAAADTISSHAGWTEFTDYSGSSRPTWSPAAAASGVKTNSASLASFTASATADIRGLFLINQITKGGTTGTLYSTGVQGSNYSLTNGQVYQIGYSVTLTPG